MPPADGSPFVPRQIRTAERHYPVLTPAGTDTPSTCVRPLVANDKRTVLFIQNVGGADGLLRFGEPVQGDGTDFLFAPGSGLLWDRWSCPLSAINLGSNGGTKWAVFEQVAL